MPPAMATNGAESVCNHTLRSREEAIAERQEADWDESFEIGSPYK